MVVVYTVLYTNCSMPTIRKSECRYRSAEEFLGDVELMFSNCEEFNEEASGVVRQARSLRAFVSARGPALLLLGDSLLASALPAPAATINSAAAASASALAPLTKHSLLTQFASDPDAQHS